MPDISNATHLYGTLTTDRPDLIELMNAALAEAYNAGNEDGYNTSDKNPSGILSTLGGLRHTDTYKMLFPEIEPGANPTPEPAPDTPSHAQVYEMARRIPLYLTTQHLTNAHAVTDVFDDDPLHIRADIGSTTAHVHLKMDDNLIPVYFGQHETRNAPHRLNPGRWTSHLAQLDQHAAQLEAESQADILNQRKLTHPQQHEPIDDSKLFGHAQS